MSLCLAFCAALAVPVFAQKKLNVVAVTVGDLGNPFFVQIAHGAQAAAKKINPSVKFRSESSNYDVNNQTNQMDNFIASGANLILLNAADSKGIAPAVMRAKAAGCCTPPNGASFRGVEPRIVGGLLRLHDDPDGEERPSLDAFGVQQVDNVARVADAFAGCAVENQRGAAGAMRRFWLSGSQLGLSNDNVSAADYARHESVIKDVIIHDGTPQIG
jgi:hypothetical protein